MHFIYLTSIVLALLHYMYFNLLYINKIPTNLHSSSFSSNILDFSMSIFVYPSLKRAWNPGLKTPHKL